MSEKKLGLKETLSRKLRSDEAIAILGACALMAPAVAIGVAVNSEKEASIDFNKPAKVSNLNYEPRKSWVAPVGKAMVPYFKTEEWEVTVRQCDGNPEDCATDTFKVSKADYQELEVGETVIPSELTK